MLKKILDSFSQRNYHSNRDYNFNSNDFMRNNYLQSSNSESKMYMSNNRFNNDDSLKNELIYKYSNYNNDTLSSNYRPYSMRKNYSSPILTQNKYSNSNYKNYNTNNDYNMNYRSNSPNYYSNSHNNAYNNDNDIMKYKDEISKLQEEINNLKSNNENLQNKLQSENTKFNEIIQMNENKLKENENLLSNIMSFIKVNSTEEIIPKLNEILSILNNGDNNNFVGKTQESIRDELISKLKGLYVTLTGSNPKEEIDIKTLWRWIKHLINTVKQLALEKEKMNNNDRNEYKQFCVQLMSKYNLKNLNELKTFIDNSLSMNNINNKQIQKITQNYKY